MLRHLPSRTIKKQIIHIPWHQAFQKTLYLSLGPCFSKSLNKGLLAILAKAAEKQRRTSSSWVPKHFPRTSQKTAHSKAPLQKPPPPQKIVCFCSSNPTQSPPSILQLLTSMLPGPWLLGSLESLDVLSDGGAEMQQPQRSEARRGQTALTRVCSGWQGVFFSSKWKPCRGF